MNLTDNGNYVKDAQNIREMLSYLEANAELLEPHQREFINSLRSQWEQRGTLSDKQFKWLARYYDGVYMDLAGEWEDVAYDCGGYGDDGHPMNYGDR